MIVINIIWSLWMVGAAAVLIQDNDLSLWNKFEWGLLLQRTHQDEFMLEGIIDIKEAKNNIRIPAAICNDTLTWRSSEKIGFQINCRCDLDFSTFLPQSKRCISNYELKQDCRYTTGSWTWLKKWTWDEIDNAPIVLDSRNDYGITVGFNATTKEFNQCTMKSVSYLKENTEWVALNYRMDIIAPVFFKLEAVWHISWNIEDLSSEFKESIQGKILKFMVDCERETVVEDDEELPENSLSSCLVFKVSGKLRFISKFNDTSTNVKATTTKNTTMKHYSGSEGNNTTTILLATFISVTVVILVIIAICYSRRSCFAIQNTETNFMEFPAVAPMLTRENDETFV